MTTLFASLTKPLRVFARWVTPAIANRITIEFDNPEDARRAFDAIEGVLADLDQIGFLSAVISERTKAP